MTAATVAPASALDALPFAPVAELSGFGSTLKYAKQPLLRFEAARRLSERAVAFEVFGRPYLALFELDAIEHVLVGAPAAFHKDLFTRDLRRVLGDGLLTSEGEAWRRHRKLMAPSFQRPEVAAYVPIMVERAQAFVSRIRPGEVLDIHSALMQLTLDVLVRALFGAHVARAPEVERLLEGLARDYRPPVVALRLLLPGWVPLPSGRRLARTRRALDAILLELIEQRRSRGDAAEPASHDLLGRLMRARDAGGSLSQLALRDEAMTLFLAGHETTALSLTYALRLLAQHPEQAAALQRELDDVLEGRAPTALDLPRLTRTRAVIDEALRLYPPAWAIGRQPREDTVLAGVRVPRATQIIVCPWVLHRDPRFFEQPERFVPERWFGAPPPRFAYMPFGAGPRVCIGSHFALVEATVLLAVLLSQASFELVPQPPLALMPSVTLRPRGAVLLRRAAPGQGNTPARPGRGRVSFDPPRPARGLR
jgi:cytochrome P450